MDDQPRRTRRSSISEHIQRVFNGDRPEKKRNAHPALVPKSEITIGFEVDRPADTAETVPSSYNSLNSRLPSVSTPGSSPLVHPVLKETYSNGADTHNGNTTNPPNGNGTTNTATPIDRICRSPTWEKDINRKERRATKRLEAERKELEKRLSHLEEAQLNLEQGIYERNSRRLTKKQPLNSSTRSSSANTERPRSNSFTSLFSRRRSRSRASSVNGSDRESRSSMENNGPPMLPLTLPEQFGTAVSRELATRHGTSLVPSHQMQLHRTLHHTTAKSDDLRENWKMAEEWKKKNDGDEVVTAKQRGRSGYVGLRPLSVPQPVAKAVPQAVPQVVPPVVPQATELSADLDRDSFTAALRHERNPPAMASRTPNAPSGNARNVAPRNMGMGTSTSKDTGAGTPTRIEHRPPASLRPNIAHAAENSPTKSFQGPRELAAAAAAASAASPSPSPSSTNHFPKKSQGRIDASPRAYKSSPLALNPFTNKDVDRRQSPRSPSNQGTQFQQPEQRQSRIPNGQRVVSPTTAAPTTPVSPTTPTATAPSSIPTPTAPSRVDTLANARHTPRQRPVSDTFREDQKAMSLVSDLQHTREAGHSPLMVPPLKHSGRRSASISSSRRPEQDPVVGAATATAPEAKKSEVPETPAKKTAEMSDTPVQIQAQAQAQAHSPTQKSTPTNQTQETRRYQLTDGGPANTSMQSIQSIQSIPQVHNQNRNHSHSHSRASSHSSYGGSSYDTADEEVLDISKAHVKNRPQNQQQQQKQPVSPTLQNSPNHPQLSPISQNIPLPLPAPAPNIRQKPPKNKPHVQSSSQGLGQGYGQIQGLSQSQGHGQSQGSGPGQILAKIFVICCNCKHWHDMPSEIYARLACPERISSLSHSRILRSLSRKYERYSKGFQKGNTGSGSGNGNSVDQVGGGTGTGAGAGDTGEVGGVSTAGDAATGAGTATGEEQLRCNWCGHSMSRNCCQGWSTIVQMRERYH